MSNRNTKHTPGPWIKVGMMNSQLGIIGPMGEPVANICRTPVEKYDARLIAAAPELLEALREVEDYLGATSANVNDPLWERVKALLAKATGDAE